MILAFQNIVVFPLILSKLILMIIDLQLINLFDDFHFSSRTFILHIHFIQFKQVNFQFFLNLIGFPFTFSLIHKLFKRWEGVTDLIKFFFIIYNDIWRVPVDFNHVDLLLQMLSFINDLTNFLLDLLQHHLFFIDLQLFIEDAYIVLSYINWFIFLRVGIETFFNVCFNLNILRNVFVWWLADQAIANNRSFSNPIEVILIHWNFYLKIWRVQALWV